MIFKDPILYSLTLRASQVPIKDIEAVYYMSEVSHLNKFMERHIELIRRFLDFNKPILVTGHDPGDHHLAEEGKYDKSIAPVAGGTVQSATLSRLGFRTKKFYGAFTGYASQVSQFNTATELRSLVGFLINNKIRNMAIYCPDQHLVRTAVTMISCLKEADDRTIRFWMIPVPTGNWQKPVSHSGGQRHANGLNLAKVEMDKFYGDSRYPNLVSAEEALSYFDWRDS